MLWSVTSESCLQGWGRRDLMAESYHIHRCTKVTYRFGCYVTLLLVNLPLLQDWISHITWISQRCTDGERKKKKLHGKCSILVRATFCWLNLLFSTTIYDTVVTHSQQSTMRLGWQSGGLAGCAALRCFRASYYPKRQTAFAESPPAPGQAHKHGRVGDPSTFYRVCVHSNQDNKKYSVSCSGP